MRIHQILSFDGRWYRQVYPDVAASGRPSWWHYLRSGASEGRSPGPAVHPRAWRARYGTHPKAGVVSWGDLAAARHCRPLVLVAHKVGSVVYGAERFFEELVETLSAAVPLWLVLPDLPSEHWVASLPPGILGWSVLPLPWRGPGRRPHPVTIALLSKLYLDLGARAVSVNTLALDEPIRAARRVGVPLVWHLHELIDYDTDLVTSWGTTPQALRAEALASGALLVANSYTSSLGWGRTLPVLANTFQASLLDLPLASPQPGPLRVGLVGSPLPKKGLGDLVRLAALLGTQDYQWRIVGAPNVHTRDLPPSLEVTGYQASVPDIYRDLDVVVNLSSFHESFGRTLVEAQAAGRAVVAYDRGAVTEVLAPGPTSLSVAPGDVPAMARTLETLRTLDTWTPALQAARDWVDDKYGTSAWVRGVREVYGPWLEHPDFSGYTSADTGPKDNE